MKNIVIFIFLLFVVPVTAEIKIGALAGSTKEGSLNAQLLQEAVNSAQAANAKITLIQLKDFNIPIYSEDLERKEGMPQDVKRLRRIFMEQDAILIASPEYNSSLTGLLKNVVDWLSRTETGQGSREAYKDKIFAIMSASPGAGGGANGLKHLRTILEALGGIVIPLQVSIPNAYQAFDEQGHLKNAESKKQLEAEIQQLISTYQARINEN